MDCFVEQLVSIKNGSKTKLLKTGIWAVCILLSVGLIISALLFLKLSFILYLLAAAALFVAYFLCSQLNVEYEYIITNKDIDIDRIVDEKRRERMASFTCSDIESIEKYNPEIHRTDKSKNINVYIGCNPDEDSYAFRIRHPKNGYYILVISPNEEFKNALRKFLPYTLKSSI